MKTELEIAIKNIKNWEFTKPQDGELWRLNIFRNKCEEHKEATKRFFAFLQALKRGQQKWLTYQIIILNEKITDLRNAIKLYDENGI
ncbi:hypothetical protein LCGC14_2325530 [marine sediment metagenome]|uniref:Uncharacterized protein n=1 Tax=marine sediment metagenome TaxID=412755 RepID=A0A0F9ETY7_9ZZZZ